MLLNKLKPDTTTSPDKLSEHRPLLFRYALMQLRDNDLAEDVVQETLLAALQADQGFRGNSELRTWLIGILKHKIADQIRLNTRENALPLNEQSAEHMDDAEEDEFFVADGHWSAPPSAWSSPETALKNLEFWSIYELCQNNLPAKMAQVFMLREIVGLEAAEICRDTDLSEANYWVTLHRARLRLRECLEIRWFNAAKGE
jgi:RNA polymerase sigma-70 factor (ECF subfamily)